ncbi:vWA domain-containing protein [Nocardia sp. NPDC052566]|uniref:vWA domain-containing protein n=1 Tax=Nocardia sp. NPDC052566 TaxID=3364330 RepID=UPI0037C5DC0B
MAIDYTKRPTSVPIDMEKIRATAPGLVDMVKTARVSLEKRALAGQRAAVYLVLDRSGSMRTHYRSGAVQRLAEQVLSLAVNLDDDGTVPVVFFSTEIDGMHEFALANYQGRINALHERMGRLGRTNYHLAMERVIDHYLASGATDPALVVFQTDGGPTSKPAAERLLCAASTLPIFWQFIGFGDDGFDFLHKLDDLPVPDRRAVDNAGFFAAGPHPRSITDQVLYENLLAEFPSWLVAARTAGIVAN